MKALWNDEHGFVISAELVLVMTIAVLAMIVGLSEVAVAVNTELNDISNAIGSLNQSYVYSGFSSFDAASEKEKSYYLGSRFSDSTDDCDLNTTCDLVAITITTSEGSRREQFESFRIQCGIHFYLILKGLNNESVME